MGLLARILSVQVMSASQATEVWWSRTIMPSNADDRHGKAPQGEDVDGFGVDRIHLRSEAWGIHCHRVH